MKKKSGHTSSRKKNRQETHRGEDYKRAKQGTLTLPPRGTAGGGAGSPRGSFCTPMLNARHQPAAANVRGVDGSDQYVPYFPSTVPSAASTRRKTCNKSRERKKRIDERSGGSTRAHDQYHQDHSRRGGTMINEGTGERNVTHGGSLPFHPIAEGSTSRPARRVRYGGIYAAGV